MAHLSDEILLHWLIKDPSWCLFYHRDQVRRMLPALAKSHVLITGIEKESENKQANLPSDGLRRERESTDENH